MQVYNNELKLYTSYFTVGLWLSLTSGLTPCRLYDGRPEHSAMDWNPTGSTAVSQSCWSQVGNSVTPMDFKLYFPGYSLLHKCAAVPALTLSMEAWSTRSDCSHSTKSGSAMLESRLSNVSNVLLQLVSMAMASRCRLQWGGTQYKH